MMFQMVTPLFYPIWFAQSSTPMYINYKDGIRVGVQLFLSCNWGPKEVLLFGHAQNVAKKFADGPINTAPFEKKKIKSCECTHELYN
jgi:hypothetical protein